MQHVLFAINNFPPTVGGVEMHVSRLADELVALGHQVTVVTVAREPGNTVERGVRVIRIRGFLRIGDVLSFPVPGTARRLRRHLAEHRVTVVSTHTRFFPMSVIGATAARRSSIPFVHTEHGSDHVRGVSLPIALASRLVDHTFGRMVLRRADAVLAVSDAVAAFVRRLSGVHADLFHNAIDVAPWFAARRIVPSVSPKLTFLGRLVPGKGWEDFLEMVALLAGTHDGAPLADIIGDGPDRERVETAVRDRGLAQRVVVRGRLEGSDLVDAVAGTILVNPTVLAEGFQTSLIEVLAAGGRVVTYPVPGAAVLHRHGAPIAIVERTPAALAAGVTRMLEHPAEVLPPDELSEWDWKTRAREYVEVLASVTGVAADQQASSSGRL